MKNYREDFDRDMTCAPKVPTADLGAWVGVEIECVIADGQINDVAEALVDDLIQGCEAKEDGSIDYNYDNGEAELELAVLTRIDDFDNLKRAIKMINKKFYGKVNSSCGLHVHLDVRDLDTAAKSKAKDNFRKALPVLSKLVAPSRLKNQYCRLQVGTGYSAVNGETQFGTFEVRLHQGSLNFKKITNWVKLNHAILRAERVDGSSLLALANSIKLDGALLDYFTERAALMANIQSGALEPSEVAA
jgi:hypothetical protein